MTTNLEIPSGFDKVIETTSIAEWRAINLIALMLGDKTAEEYEELNQWFIRQYKNSIPLCELINRYEIRRFKKYKNSPRSDN